MQGGVTGDCQSKAKSTKGSGKTNPGADAQDRGPTSIFLPTICDPPKQRKQNVDVRCHSNVVEQTASSSQ
ncbi:hypothetical protein CEE69_31320 [Rhodopirellula bahusiensis]|uniref:Uncharacterized protein n=1 Tax=Rhodopirellula bahusiensis TaxID=2014065 RepID=A0A2G1VXE6_9BACT|nr:hypothetical protein CEE69_31260 [Rhodopirellula bahusiensis]PHQ31411.1 hypothetical protein CEE69_31320 [Rhodopirellula bahusiensis]